MTPCSRRPVAGLGVIIEYVRVKYNTGNRKFQYNCHSYGQSMKVIYIPIKGERLDQSLGHKMCQILDYCDVDTK